MRSSIRPFDLKQRIALASSVFLLFVLSIGWTLLAGKDINFDQLNYHLYGPRLLLEDRWEIDYFAASLQTYLNGVSYLPFYWMVTLGWNDRLIAIILATVHFLNIILVLALAAQVLDGSGWRRLVLLVIACALALIAPIYLIQVGSSFNDPLSSIFVLGALLLYLTHEKSPRVLWSLALSGVCLGIAMGIKLTNAIFIFGVLAVAAVDYAPRFRRYGITLARAAVLGFGVIIGFLALHGYWSWKLLANFDNPIFPYYNNIFHAPDFPSVSIQDKRFLGGGWLGLFMLPFQMVRSEAWIYTETIAPDLRFAALVVLTAVLPISRVIRKLRSFYPAVREEAVSASVQRRTTKQIVIFFVVSFLVWGVLFRIGRYGLVLWLLIPVLIVAVLQTEHLKRYAIGLGGIIILTQSLLSMENRLERWEGTRWSGNWLDLDIPQQISDSPGVFLSLETQSLSAVGLKLSPDAALVNLTGQYVQPSGASMRPRLREILHNDARPIYLMRSFNRAEQVIQAIDWERIDWSGLNSVLMPYGLKMTPGGKCTRGALNFTPTTFFAESNRPGGYEIFFCRLQRANQNEVADAVARQTRFDRLFERIERICPSSFYPPGSSTVLTSGQYVRSYFNTGMHMLTSQGVLYAGALRRLELVALADFEKPLSELLDAPIACPPAVVERYLR